MHPKTATLLILLLSAVGLADSVYLTWDHQLHRVDPSAETSICARGSGCEIARFHPLSEINLGSGRPGLPISLIGLGAYLVFLALGWMRLKSPQNREPARLTFLLSIIAVLYSAFLAFISMLVQGALCPLCAVLYAVNFGLFLASANGLGESMITWAGGVQSSVFSRSGLVATTLMAVTLTVGYAVYAPPVRAADANRIESRRADARALGSTPVVAVDVSGRPTFGSPDAAVHMVEFADFGCGHCAVLYEMAHQYMVANPEQLRMSFIHYPLSSDCNPAIPERYNPTSCLLAYASECAHQQGQWEAMAAHLFSEGRGLEREALVAFAPQVGLDMERFTQCLDAPETKATIIADAELGVEAGVDGTPTFLLNGHRVIGNRNAEIFDLMVQSVVKGGE